MGQIVTEDIKFFFYIEQYFRNIRLGDLRQWWTALLK